VLSSGRGRGYAQHLCSVLEAGHGLCAAWLGGGQLEDILGFAVKVLSLLERIFAVFDLSAFVLEGWVVPNLTSGVMGLATVIQTALSRNDGFGPLLWLCFGGGLLQCTSRCCLSTGP